MRFVADENVDRPIVEALRHAGHEVAYVAELSPSVADEQVLEMAGPGSTLLLTSGKDFGELLFRQRRTPNGVVLMRLSGLSLERKASAVISVVEARAAELLGRFTVITPGAVRIRRAQ